MPAKPVGLTVTVLLVACVFAYGAWRVQAQQQDEGDQITAKSRFLPEIGAGLRAMKRGADGNYYILTAPADSVSVFDDNGKPLRKIPNYAAGAGPQNKELRAIRYGEDMDVDASGTVYVADRGANCVKIWAADGTARLIAVQDPISVAALPDGEVAVVTLRAPHLIVVFGKDGRETREFGDPEEISECDDLNRFLNLGAILTDAKNHLYYGFVYMPEPTVRQYDVYGYAGTEIQYTEMEAAPEAAAVRREIKRQEEKGKQPAFKRVITGFGVDRSNGEAWVALHNTLLHFDKDGNRRATYQLYTMDGARLEANTVLISQDRLLVGSDVLGIYAFARPDKKTP